jgi:hypothetical protein
MTTFYHYAATGDMVKTFIIILSTDELIQAIRNDISVASQRLEEEENKKHVSKLEEYIRTKL